jgi:hypothetical protein
MKISNSTLSILKNFSTINKGILLTPGNTLQTRTSAIFASANIEEDFPLEVGIYDVSNFLSVVALFDEAEFEFSEECLRISEADGSADTNYYYAGAGIVQMSSKRKKADLPSQTIDFVMTEEQWSKIQKAASVLQKTEIKITSDGKVVRMTTENHKQPAGNDYSLVMSAEPHGYSCKMVFDLNNLKLMKGAYSVTVTPNYTQFKSTSGPDLTYLIGAEPTTSHFG